MGHISCFSKGCSQPVIGQCGGYNTKCGRYYCADHSTEILCAHCAKDQAADYMLSEYMQIANTTWDKVQSAQNWPNFGICVSFMLILGCFTYGVVGGESGLMRISQGSQPSDIRIVILGVVGICLGIMFIIRLKNKNKAIEVRFANEIEATKPGFSTFFMEYIKLRKEDEAKRSRALSALIGTVIVGAAVQAHQQYKQEQTRKDIRDISKSLKDINRKL